MTGKDGAPRPDVTLRWSVGDVSSAPRGARRRRSVEQAFVRGDPGRLLQQGEHGSELPLLVDVDLDWPEPLPRRAQAFCGAVDRRELFVAEFAGDSPARSAWMVVTSARAEATGLSSVESAIAATSVCSSARSRGPGSLGSRRSGRGAGGSGRRPRPRPREPATLEHDVIPAPPAELAEQGGVDAAADSCDAADSEVAAGELHPVQRRVVLAPDLGLHPRLHAAPFLLNLAGWAIAVVVIIYGAL
jgi:hypothetical protein